MIHERMHELLALRLYGELDETEQRELEEHLTRCEACANYGEELARGLAPLRAAADSTHWEAPPQDWSVRVDELARTGSARPWGRLLTFVAGAAAGVIATLGLQTEVVSPQSPSSPFDKGERGDRGYVESAEPPEPSPIRGRLVSLSRARR